MYTVGTQGFLEKRVTLESAVTLAVGGGGLCVAFWTFLCSSVIYADACQYFRCH